MHTADDDSVPVPHGALKLPRAVLHWRTPPLRGAAWRAQRDELEPEDTDVTRVDLLSDSRLSTRAARDALVDDDDPTRAIQTSIPPRRPERGDALPGSLARVVARLQGLLARGAARFEALLPRAAAHLNSARAQAAKLWRAGPLRTALLVAGAVLVTYLAVSARRGSDARTQTVLVPVAVPAAAVPIIVEQLNGSHQPSETVATPPEGEQSEKAGRRSASSRARVTSIATTPVSKSGGSQVIVPAESKSKSQSSRTERSSNIQASSAAGLPAWGVEAVREFSGEKSPVGASVRSDSQALAAKPASASAGIPAPVQPKAEPVAAAKPAEPVKPAEPLAPPPPSKPLTMDQVLNQVEEAAQAQRKQAGLKAPKASKRDAELDELINGAMKSKTK